MASRLKLRVKDPAGDSCPVVGAIREIVTESRLLVVRHLFTGPKGFNELSRVSGINSKTLSATLKALEGHGIVDRKVVSTRPFLVQYSLTPSGLDLKSALEAFGEWGTKWLPQPGRHKTGNRHAFKAPKIPSR